MMNSLITVVLMSLSLLQHKVIAERDRFMYCGACLCMVEEMGWQLGATDEKKTIQVGSFRLDDRGHQKGAVEKQFKRSEVHMIELLEGICSTMYDYHIQTKPSTGRKSFVRTSSRTGETISLANVMISEDTTKKLRFSCDTLLEEYEDDIIELYQKQEKNIEEKLCVNIAKVCTIDDVESQRWATVDAIVAGMKEQMGGSGEDDDEYADEDDEYEDDEYEDEDDEYEDEDDEYEEEDDEYEEEDDEYANEEEGEEKSENDRRMDEVRSVVTEVGGARNKTDSTGEKEEL